MMIGSALAGKFAHRYPQTSLIWTGYGLMMVAALANIGYNLFFAAAVPWAVLPLFLYSFALSIAMPPMTLTALNYFPDNSGLASSMQSFIQMLLFALVSGVVAPLLFDSALKLAWGVMGGLLLSALCWIGVRRDAASAAPATRN
jgi:DHA1 family bicyclomycin/chloramphenicol resistance-like MFS transporter